MFIYLDCIYFVLVLDKDYHFLLYDFLRLILLFYTKLNIEFKRVCCALLF